MSTLAPKTKIIPRENIAAVCKERRALGERIVFTNGCFDILHVGHIELLHAARKRGDFLVVGLNSDASVRRLKGDSRPINDETARALVLAALGDVGAVCVFEESTPVELIRQVRPNVHVKGGDYVADELPEAAAVKECGGEIVIVPLEAGFSTTSTLAQLQTEKTASAVLIIPARYGSTRFPGKPLAQLGRRAVIEHVIAAALQTRAARPVLVATDDERIADAVRASFSEDQAQAVMTSTQCATGTDRLAEVVQARFAERLKTERLIVVNIQGDEPFIEPRHVDALIDTMQADASLPMATLATPLEAAQENDPNVVKAVRAQNGDALYFSRLPVPFEREASTPGAVARLRHLGIYAYEANWLLEMAKLPPSPLEEIEKLEQLRALENGARIGVLVVDDVVPIAIDTPEDLIKAEEFFQSRDAAL